MLSGDTGNTPEIRALTNMDVALGRASGNFQPDNSGTQRNNSLTFAVSFVGGWHALPVQK